MPGVLVAPSAAMDVLPAADVANVVSIDATGWSARAELLNWAGLSSSTMPASRYNCALLDWQVRSAQGYLICGSAVRSAACVGRSLEHGAFTVTGMPDMDEAAGALNIPQDGAFVSPASLGAAASGAMGVGVHRVATLTLEVAAGSAMQGQQTYRLWLSNGSYSKSDGTPMMMEAGPAFEIRVGGQ